MEPGGGFETLLFALVPLVGLVTLMRARSRRRNGPPAPDPDLDRRLTDAAEMERRMASYLAGRPRAGE
jgi:hypothetical protein